MSKNGLPDPITKREIIYGDRKWNLSTEECGNLAMKEGSYTDALHYYNRAKSTTKITEILEKAVEDGNAYFLALVESLTEVKGTRSHWETLAKNAEKKEKFAYQKQANLRLEEMEE